MQTKKRYLSINHATRKLEKTRKILANLFSQRKTHQYRSVF